MKKSTLYSNPTVKEVVFQVRFPQLFFLEGKIGDFQLAIMEKFPKSKLLIQQQFTIGLTSLQQPVAASQNMPIATPPPIASKSWSFESDNGMTVILSYDSLSITSKKHKSFSSSQDADENFRDMIIFVTDAFLHNLALPVFSRIGLRYIDVCNGIDKNTSIFQTLFKTRLPVNCFPLEDSIELFFHGVTDRKDAMLIYKEQIISKKDLVDFVFDFDAYQQNVAVTSYKGVLDSLYMVIAQEYDSVITAKMKKRMKPINSRKK